MSRRRVRLFLAAFHALVGFTGVAAAQSTGEVESIMCGTGVGVLLGIIFIALALFFFVKSGIMAMDALDKMQSGEQSTHSSGKDKLKSAGYTFSAILIPGVMAGVTEIIGLSTVSCITPSDWSLISTAIISIAVTPLPI